MSENYATQEQVTSDELDSSVEDQTSALAPQPEFYRIWQCEVVVIQVENSLFSVLKQGLMVPGSVFADMFALPANPQIKEGRDAVHPIILQGIKAADFSSFLTVLYPWLGGKKKPAKTTKLGSGANIMLYSCTVNLNTSQWLGVLDLATQWNYAQIRNEAIGILDSSLSRGAQKIQMGTLYHVEKWVKEGYYDIVSKNGLEIEELANDFGLETMTKIFYIQAVSLVHLGGNYCQGSCSYGAHTAECVGKRNGLKDARKLIDTIFKDDIASAYYNPVTNAV